MVKPTAYVIFGEGIGCENEIAHAYKMAGANAELVHVRQLLSGDKKLSGAQIVNFTGGFLHGDMGGAGMYAATDMEHSIIRVGDNDRKFKDMLLEEVMNGLQVYGQCNGFQWLVKMGLLPGIDGDYSEQTVTLTGNAIPGYYEDFTPHVIEGNHPVFGGLENGILLSCRHAEGNLQFYSPHGLVSKEKSEEVRRIVNQKHVILRYGKDTNGSVDGIAGLMDPTGNIIAHMAHPEVGIYASRDPRWFADKDKLRRKGVKAAELEDHVHLAKPSTIFIRLVERAA